MVDRSLRTAGAAYLSQRLWAAAEHRQQVTAGLPVVVRADGLHGQEQ